MKQPLTADAFGSLTGLTPGIVERLSRHLEILRVWQPRINLVGRATLDDPWRRHVLDSVQLLPLLPPGRPVLADLGSGAGFPGLVLAIASGAEVVVVESDARKCAFLREAARATEASITIENRRIETLPPALADVVSARALAPLPKLLPLAAPLLRSGGIGLFLKGRGVEGELTAAAETWTMRVERRQSLSDTDGIVIKLTDIKRRDDR